jgi:hypothetical protein
MRSRAILHVRFAAGTVARNPLAPIYERVLARQPGVMRIRKLVHNSKKRSSTNAVRIADTSTHQNLAISSDLSRSNVPVRWASQIGKELPVPAPIVRPTGELRFK